MIVLSSIQPSSSTFSVSVQIWLALLLLAAAASTTAFSSSTTSFIAIRSYSIWTSSPSVRTSTAFIIQKKRRHSIFGHRFLASGRRTILASPPSSLTEPKIQMTNDGEGDIDFGKTSTPSASASLRIIMPELVNVAIRSAILAGNIIVSRDENGNNRDETATTLDDYGGGNYSPENAAGGQPVGSTTITTTTKIPVWKQKANRRDLLTLMDPLCEKTIREMIFKSFPDHDFLGEEDVPPGKEASAAAIDAKLSSSSATVTSSSTMITATSTDICNDKCTSKYLWIVDPIDGTTNFVHGSPLCGPSIALAYEGEVVVGVIYDPYRKEIFYAAQECGAYVGTVVENEKVSDGNGNAIVDITATKNDQIENITDARRQITPCSSSSSGIRIINERRITPSPPSRPSIDNDVDTDSSSSPSYLCRDASFTLAESLVAMGSPPGDESLAMSLRALPVLMPKVRSIRMIGSAAIMLAWVADGRLSAYWEYDLSSWDVAAGSILIEESGGKITNLNNERWDLRTRKICATVAGGEYMHDELLKTLAEAGVV